jgi:type III secretion system low calcium response chaperone LcrH/SycD
MVTVADFIKTELDKLGSKVPADQRKAYEEVLLKIFRDGMSPKEAMGLSDETMEALYGYAYRLYESGNYTDSQRIFQYLVNFNAEVTKYSLGLAACYHMQKKYQAAIEAYMLNALFDQESPIPFYHIADCYIKMEQPEGALLALDDAIRMAFLPRHTLIRERAIMMRKKIRDELGLEDTPPPIKDYLTLQGCDLEGIDIEKLFIDGEENMAKYQAEIKRITEQEEKKAVDLVPEEHESLEPGRKWDPPVLEL